MDENSARITVLMSVYNGERYLREAVDSILRQTFSDFEFVIIDDGSTDKSGEIIESYGDSRIRFISNGRTLGLAASLNKGLDCARGEYIARMDSDDISLPERLERQSRFLDSNPDVDVVSSLITLIDESGRYAGVWKEDADNVSREDICRMMPASNCLAHPSSMVRRNVLLRFRYDERLKSMQDYDLWLRMCSAGIKLDKLKTPLLRYRMHGSSVTASSSRTSLIGRVIKLKANYLAHQALRRRLGRFEFSVFRFLCGDMLEFIQLKTGKKNAYRTRNILAGIGRMLSSLFVYENKSKMFFFVPPAAPCGAEHVHADIVSCFGEAVPHVFIAGKSKDRIPLDSFGKNARVYDISGFAGNKFSRNIAAGCLAGLINRHGKSVVLGSKSEFFHELLPRLSDEVRTMEVLHSCAGQEEINWLLSCAARIDCRIVTNESLKTMLIKAYREQSLPEELCGRIEVIDDTVYSPDSYVRKGAGRIKIIYVGCAALEERTYLLGAVASTLKKTNPDWEFYFIGKDVHKYIDGENLPDCICLGRVSEQSKMREIYTDAHMILVSSRSEGFPTAIMEAMAFGVVPACTNTGGISVHIKDGLNGLLVASGEEGEIIRDMSARIEHLLSNPDAYAEMSYSAYDYAKSNFGRERFEHAYRKLVLSRLQ